MRRVNGKRLRAIRKDKGYSLSKAASDAGISLGYLSNIESGSRGSGFVDLLDRLAKAYGMELEIRMVSRSEDKSERVEYL